MCLLQSTYITHTLIFLRYPQMMGKGVPDANQQTGSTEKRKTRLKESKGSQTHGEHPSAARAGGSGISSSSNRVGGTYAATVAPVEDEEEGAETKDSFGAHIQVIDRARRQMVDAGTVAASECAKFGATTGHAPSSGRWGGARLFFVENHSIVVTFTQRKRSARLW